MMLYRFEVGYTVPGKMGNKNYVTAVAATDAAHARMEAGKIFEGLKEDYGYDKALGKLYPNIIVDNSLRKPIGFVLEDGSIS